MDNKSLSKEFLKLKARDKDAFTLIYNELKIPVYTIAYRIVGSTQIAEDITQEVFVRMFSTPPDSDIKNPRAWVFTVTRNLSIDSIKKAKLKSIDDIIETAENKENEIITKLDIEDALRTLSQTEREIITLHLNAGLSFKEISKIINLSLPSTYRRYKKALSKLRILLSGGSL